MIQPIQVSENIFRGPRPETSPDFDKLAALAVVDLLDLQGAPWEVLTRFANLREYLGYMRGFRSIRIAMNGFLPPNQDDVELALDTLTYKKIYVHCRWGKDRTGYVIAAWRMRVCGWTYDQAVAEMYANGFHRIYFYWLPSLRKYERKAA